MALLDDITTLLDDVATMTKVATKKTVAVLGDDLALNAQQVSGCPANRELPIIWGVVKGSLVNKAILIPLALLISAFAPWLITPLLIFSGAYLSFEGVETVVEKIFLRKAKEAQKAAHVSPKTLEELIGDEKQKIKGAIRTDFALSIEIIIIAIGSLPLAMPLLDRSISLIIVGVLVTFGVYGAVALIVKLDDIGLFFVKASHGKGALNIAGRILLGCMPHLMRLLTFVGTVAMFLVGGGILAHGIPWIEVHIESLSGLFLPGIKAGILHMAVGAVIGGAIFAINQTARSIYSRIKKEA